MKSLLELRQAKHLTQAELGDRLKELRVGKDLSQESLANMVGVSPQAVSNWENGVRQPVRKLKELTALFGVTAGYIMGLDESPQPEQIELPAEPAPPTREDVIKAFANLLDVASEYLARR